MKRLGKVGRVLEVDCSHGRVVYGRCLRVHIMLDATKPLCRGTSLIVGQSHSIFLFRYEKLADYCYLYGHLDHLNNDCLSLFICNWRIFLMS